MSIGWRTGGLAMMIVLVAAGAPGDEAAAAAGGRASSGGLVHPDDRSGSRTQSGHRHHHHRSRSDFGWIGGAAFWPWGDYPPYYPLVDMPLDYIERGEQEIASADHWLYCASVRGYFPEVGVCAEGWERVPAVPPE